jgi:hypothetical protein
LSPIAEPPLVAPHRQPGEYILREGAPLDEAAKFYMIEHGRVDCFRTFEVRLKWWWWGWVG